MSGFKNNKNSCCLILLSYILNDLVRHNMRDNTLGIDSTEMPENLIIITCCYLNSLSGILNDLSYTTYLASIQQKCKKTLMLLAAIWSCCLKFEMSCAT